MLEKPVESLALHILQELGYSTHSYSLLMAEDSVIKLIRADILLDKLRMLNPLLPEVCLCEAIRQVKLVQHPTQIRNNMAFHKLLVESDPVSYRQDGRIVNTSAKLIDFDLVDNNSFMAVSQMTVVKRILRKYGYPPDKQEKATDLVIEQAELICGDIAG